MELKCGMPCMVEPGCNRRCTVPASRTHLVHDCDWATRFPEPLGARIRRRLRGVVAFFRYWVIG